MRLRLRNPPPHAPAPSLVVCAAQHAPRLTADADALRHRSAPDVWSPLEYACHVRDVLGVQRERMLRTQAEDEMDVDRGLGAAR